MGLRSDYLAGSNLTHLRLVTTTTYSTLLAGSRPSRPEALVSDWITCSHMCPPIFPPINQVVLGTEEGAMRTLPFHEFPKPGVQLPVITYSRGEIRRQS